MKLRLGQPVHATDILFGEIGDIVVDPVAGAVTHIVVQPHNDHFQARLVPVGLVSEEPAGLTVQLDAEHLRRLERVAHSDFIRLGDAIQVGDDWDIGTEDVIYTPYQDFEFDNGWSDPRVGTFFDRIPKGDCEIRRSSQVIVSGDKTVGHVEGFLADDDHLTAIVVRVGLPGLRRTVMVPFSAVAKVRNDQIDLSIDENQFDLLPQTDAFGEPDKLTGHVNDLKDGVEAVRAKLADRGRHIFAAAETRFGGRR